MTKPLWRKTQGKHGYRGKTSSRGKRLLSKLGNLTTIARLEMIFQKLAKEKYKGSIK